jgi:hypothetical protein
MTKPMTLARVTAIAAGVVLFATQVAAQDPNIPAPEGATPPDAPDEATIKSEAAVKSATPTWPCIQRKVDKISVAQVWDGPPIEGVKGWGSDSEIRDLVTKLANRRVAVKDVEALVKAFAEKQPADARDKQLTLLFAGYFDTVHSQRRSVITGIEKYLKAQRERSTELERQSSNIGDLEKKAAADPKANEELDKAREQFDWAQRIFQDRQSSIPIACEIPGLIDERIYEIAKSIRALMTS